MVGTQAPKVVEAVSNLRALPCKPQAAVPSSGQYVYPTHPRRNPPDVIFLDPAYARGYPVNGKPSKPWLVGYWHTGVDWNFGGGNDDLGQPVHAVTDGVVLLARRMAGTWGNMIVLYHPGPDVWTRYAHQNRMLVKPGQVVKVGQQIGEVGNSGSSARAPMSAHLHFDVFKQCPPSWNFFPKDKALVMQHCIDPLEFFQKQAEAGRLNNPPRWNRG